MIELYLHNRKIDSVFQLLGEHENDMSFSLAWALTQCPAFLNTFLRAIIGHKLRTQDCVVRMQQHESGGGFTDIEIESPSYFYLIMEAKRGWNLPGNKQLKLYASRSSFISSNAPFKRIIALSECSREYAELHLKARDILGVHIEPLSWQDIIRFVKSARSGSTHAGKRLLDELQTYIRGIMTMQKIDSNWVYVVALAYGTPPGWHISWIDIVKKHRRYFHPVGGGRGGWPKEPPNYIAFRYYGKLQSIHHIEGYEVITNIHERIPEIPDVTWEPHFLYRVGKGFGPDKEIKTGNIYRNGRVWCMLDTLFTCDTISAARDLSRKRESQSV